MGMVFGMAVVKVGLVVVVMLVSALAYGGVYKCTGPEGKTVYQDRPCKGEALPEGSAPNASAPSKKMAPAQRKAMCQKAVKNGKEILALSQDLVELGQEIGKGNSAQQKELKASLRTFRPLMRVSRCQKAKGVEEKFYHCISDDNNVPIKCAKRVGMAIR